ncbi:hypothetical protein HXX76_014008 [Chlamydomonas incerta]|uniref:Uncharacterized protein n=1 Tax=Chlamydomonas incerta TaxID=51695 RepID=A0A835VTN0_CHLIN|nr:hypothetical protein HXX76_014008 [Chlamydomonas incerta]|eukprot:KAG2425099.1 hypothetical protein HXX76_014008 [Chlamydomonas incerta]
MKIHSAPEIISGCILPVLVVLLLAVPLLGLCLPIFIFGGRQSTNQQQLAYTCLLYPLNSLSSTPEENFQATAAALNLSAAALNGSRQPGATGTDSAVLLAWTAWAEAEEDVLADGDNATVLAAASDAYDWLVKRQQRLFSRLKRNCSTIAPVMWGRVQADDPPLYSNPAWAYWIHLNHQPWSPDQLPPDPPPPPPSPVATPSPAPAAVLPAAASGSSSNGTGGAAVAAHAADAGVGDYEDYGSAAGPALPPGMAPPRPPLYGVAAYVLINATLISMDVASGLAKQNVEVLLGSMNPWAAHGQLLDQHNRLRPDGVSLHVDVVTATGSGLMTLGKGDRVGFKQMDIIVDVIRSSYFYPFDEYRAVVKIASYVGNDTYHYPIAMLLSQRNAAVGWSQEVETLQDVQENFMLWWSGSSENQEGEVHLAYAITIRRSGFTKLFCVLILMGMWALTGSAASYAMDLVFLRPRNAALADGVMFVTLLFAMPGLRNVMPGVPPIGVGVDLYGFLWIMLLCILCGCTVLAKLVAQYVHPGPTLYDRARKNDVYLEWRKKETEKEERAEKREKRRKAAEKEREEQAEAAAKDGQGAAGKADGGGDAGDGGQGRRPPRPSGEVVIDIMDGHAVRGGGGDGRGRKPRVSRGRRSSSRSEPRSDSPGGDGPVDYGDADEHGGGAAWAAAQADGGGGDGGDFVAWATAAGAGGDGGGAASTWAAAGDDTGGGGGGGGGDAACGNGCILPVLVVLLLAIPLLGLCLPIFIVGGQQSSNNQQLEFICLLYPLNSLAAQSNATALLRSLNTTHINSPVLQAWVAWAEAEEDLLQDGDNATALAAAQAAEGRLLARQERFFAAVRRNCSTVASVLWGRAHSHSSAYGTGGAAAVYDSSAWAYWVQLNQQPWSPGQLPPAPPPPPAPPLPPSTGQPALLVNGAGGSGSTGSQSRGAALAAQQASGAGDYEDYGGGGPPAPPLAPGTALPRPPLYGIAAYVLINATLISMDVVAGLARQNFELHLGSLNPWAAARARARAAAAGGWLLDERDRLQPDGVGVHLDVVTATGSGLMTLSQGDRVGFKQMDIIVDVIRSSYFYPFDEYRAVVKIVAYVGNDTYRYPIALLLNQRNAAVGWSQEVETLQDVQENYLLWWSGSSENQEGEVHLTYAIVIRRSIFTQVFCFLILIGMWVLSGCAASYAVDLVFLRPRTAALVDATLFVTLLFAMPNIRGVMPGVPAIGVGVDLFGFIWIMLLCIVSGSMVLAKLVAQYVHPGPTLYDRARKNDVYLEWRKKEAEREERAEKKRKADKEREEQAEAAAKDGEGAADKADGGEPMGVGKAGRAGKTAGSSEWRQQRRSGEHVIDVGVAAGHHSSSSCGGGGGGGGGGSGTAGGTERHPHSQQQLAGRRPTRPSSRSASRLPLEEATAVAVGCGASVARSPASMGALNPGDLRDASLPPTVVLHEGVAQAGARTHITPAAPAPAPAAAAAAGAEDSQQPAGDVAGGGGGGSSKSKDAAAAGAKGAAAKPAAASATAAPAAGGGGGLSAAGDSAADSAAETESGSVGGTWLLVDVPAAAAPTAATSAAAAGGAAAAAAAESEPAVIVGEVDVSDGAAPPSATAAAAAAAEAEAKTPQQAPHQPRMVDCAVSLQFLIDFSATQVPEDMPTWKVVTDIVVPATRDRRCRYVEHIEARHVGHCHYFISHRWATPFSHLVRYARKHLVELGDVVEVPPPGAADQDGFTAPEGKRRADQVFVWCDIFAINQASHPSQVQADDLSQLKDCVEASAQTLLCLDDKGLVLTRIWCLYEIWNTVLAGGPPKLAVLGYDVNEAAFKEVYITLDVAEAQATVESDRVRILDDIAASTGLQELNLVLKNALVDSTQHEADYAQRVLMPRIRRQEDANVVNQYIIKHIQMLNNVGRHVESGRYSQLLRELGEKSSAIFRKQQQRLVDSQPAAAAAAAGGGDSGCGEAAAAEGEGEDAAEPDWHWSHYPRDAALRKIFARAKGEAGHGRYEQELAAYREALAQAEAAAAATSTAAASGRAAADAAAAAAALDAAGCRLALSMCLKRQGYNEQAGEEAEAALQPYEAHAEGGGGGLTYASAAVAVAVLLDSNWAKKELIAGLLGDAHAVQSSRLGATHAATLSTLEARAKAAMFGGDMAAALELNRQLCLGLSSAAGGGREGDGGGGGGGPGGGGAAAGGGGLDLTMAAETPVTHAAVAKLSIAALDAWRTYLTYLAMPQYGGGQEDRVIRACRLLIPPRRRQHIRIARDVVGGGGSSEYLEQSKQLLSKLEAAAAGASDGAVATAGGSAAAAATAEPGALLDADDPAFDCGMHVPELTAWGNALAAQGAGEAAVRMQWRIADVFRHTGNTMAYGATKLSLVEAYEQGVVLDASMPGASKLARAMLAQRDGAAAADASSRPGSAAAAAISGAPASGTAAGSGRGAGGAAAAAAAAAATPYDGPSYMQLVKELTTWSEDIAKTGAPDYERYVQIQRQMWACQAAEHGACSSQAVQARTSLAQAISTTGRKEEAVAEMRAALADHEAVLGGKDPQMVHTLTGLAGMLDDRVEGEALHRRAVALVEKVHGPSHRDVGSALQNLGSYIMGGGDMARFQEGQDLMAKGMQIMNKFMEEQNAKAKAF